MSYQMMGTLAAAARAGVVAGMVTSPAFSSFDTWVAETEPNDDFSSREMLDPSVREVDGSLFGQSNEYGGYGGYGGGGDEVIGIPGSGDGDVDFFAFQGLTPGNVFEVFTSVSNLDTLLGQFDNSGSLLAADDDSSPTGDFGSALAGIVDSSGNVNVGVTGFGDFSFEGFHFENGDYTLTLNTVGLDDIEQLESFENVFLTDTDSDTPGFQFDLTVNAGEIVIIDPPVAVGYDYVSEGAKFSSVQLPNVGGDDSFLVTFLDGTGEEIVVPVNAGEVFDFNGLSVPEFTVTGIDPLAELDPENPLAFPTAVTFEDSGSFIVSQTAIIPTPATAWLLALGAAGIVVQRRRR